MYTRISTLNQSVQLEMVLEQSQRAREEYHVLKEVNFFFLFHFTKFYNDRRAFCFPFFFRHEQAPELINQHPGIYMYCIIYIIKIVPI